jgi:GrpB protein
LASTVSELSRQILSKEVIAGAAHRVKDAINATPIRRYGHRLPVKVVPYSPDWPVRFAQVAMVLRTTLATVPSAAVEHVGSTSVPGLAAKRRILRLNNPIGDPAENLLGPELGTS